MRQRVPQYVESILAPHRISQDRLWSWTSFRCHKSEFVRLAIEARGCRVLFATSLFA
jgi:hypothetical protein